VNDLEVPPKGDGADYHFDIKYNPEWNDWLAENQHQVVTMV
jgi:hypothetical protein